MSNKKQPQRVWITIHNYKEGPDVAVFKTEKAANEYRDNIAIEGWDIHFQDFPLPKENVGNIYFGFIEQFGQEWFEIEEQEIQE